MSVSGPSAQLAVLYEHPQWFQPLFAALERRGVVYEAIQLSGHSFDPEDRFAPPRAPKRVTRGGSFLCNQDYCLSYRPSARRGNDPFNPMSHIGFRLVKDAPASEAAAKQVARASR